jgi:formate dehydrogenase subunit gamma
MPILGQAPRLLLRIGFLTAGSAGFVYALEDPAIAGLLPVSSADYYRTLMGEVAGNWQNYGQLFTTLQGQWFWKAFLLIITAIPGVFLLHYLIIGAKHFDHGGEQVLFFPLLTRVVHFFAALSFSLLVLTGLMIVFGKYLGGGALVRSARSVHLLAAMVFIIPACMMLVMWLKDMLPRLHDIAWLFILGGYLSKRKKPVPAGKFNAGQKMYFWSVTLGGAVMAFTGYVIWGMGADVETVRLYAIIHNTLGMGLLAFYLTHVYMAVFAIAGSLKSMKSGYKPKEEVDILHSRYKYQ